MKKYIFRKTFNGFYDWLGIIQTARRQIVAYENIRNLVIKNDPAEKESYHEAKHVYKNYLLLKKQLNDVQQEIMEYKIHHHIPPYSLGSYKELCDMYEKWLLIEFPDGKERFTRYSKKDIGKVIKTARLEDGRSRKELAEILCISENTLKCYEEGRRMIPTNIFIEIKQILSF